jgi:hypothetical protein
MAVARQNLTVYQGADYQASLEVRDESSVLMDLTGYTFRGQARTDYSAASPSLEFDFTIRDQVSEPGVVDMRITAADTSALSISKRTTYLYDIEMVDTNSIVKRIVEGRLELYPEVTK